MEKTWQIKLPEWLVWRLYGVSMESDILWRFYGKISLEIVWDLMEKTWQVKLPEWLVWRLCGDCMETVWRVIFLWRFYGKISLEIIRDLMEKTWQIKLPEWLVWRLYGDSLESDIFYGDFMAKLVWRLSGISWRKHGKSNHAHYQTISMLILHVIETKYFPVGSGTRVTWNVPFG